MNINELMIGDWVNHLYYNKPIQWEPEEFFMKQSSGYITPRRIEGRDIEPIELTRKILLDNGFQKIKASHHDFFRLSSSKDYDEWSIEVDPAPYGGYFMVNAEHTSDGVYQGGIDDMKISYVHELQHILTMLRFPIDIKLNVQP